MTITSTQTAFNFQLLTSDIDTDARNIGNINGTAASRWCKLTWKSTKHPATKQTIPALSPNLCVEVPITPISVTPDILATALQQAFEQLQDLAIRAYVEKELTNGKSFQTPLTSLHIDTLAPANIAAFAADIAKGSGHLNKSLITEFFNTGIKAPLELRIVEIAASKNITLTDTQLTAQLQTYLDSFTALAAPTTIFSVEVAKKLQQVFLLTNLDAVSTMDSTREKIAAKLTKFLNPTATKNEVLFDIG